MKWPSILVRRPGESRQQQAVRGSKELREMADEAGGSASSGGHALGGAADSSPSQPGESTPPGAGETPTSEAPQSDEAHAAE